MKTRLRTLAALYGHYHGLIGLVPWFLYGVVDFWRNEGPEDHQPPRFLELIPWWAIAIASLLLILLVGLEAAHREITASRQTHSLGSPTVSAALANACRALSRDMLDFIATRRAEEPELLV